MPEIHNRDRRTLEIIACLAAICLNLLMQLLLCIVVIIFMRALLPEPYRDTNRSWMLAVYLGLPALLTGWGYVLFRLAIKSGEPPRFSFGLAALPWAVHRLRTGGAQRPPRGFDVTKKR